MRRTAQKLNIVTNFLGHLLSPNVQRKQDVTQSVNSNRERFKGTILICFCSLCKLHGIFDKISSISKQFNNFAITCMSRKETKALMEGGAPNVTFIDFLTKVIITAVTELLISNEFRSMKSIQGCCRWLILIYTFLVRPNVVTS